MNIISSIISTLTLEERKHFITYLKKKNKRNDTKNILLFKLLASQPNKKDLDIAIYNKKAKGALHALCKRLHDSLIDFIAINSFESETSEEMETMKLLVASRIFFEQKKYNLALKTIKKSELKAKKHELHSILNEIYYTKIQYAHVDTKNTLEAIIQDFKTNQKILKTEENLLLFYASIQNKLIISSKSIVQKIENSLSKYDLSSTQDFSFRSLYKLLNIINQSAHITHNYYTVLPFVKKVYHEIKTKKNLSSKHLFFHIHVLYFVANSYFRNKEFNISLEYLANMKQLMLQQNKKYYHRFFLQYTLLQVLNLNYTGNADKAIEKLEKLNYHKFKDQTDYILDLKLSLIVFYFQQQQNQEALKLYKKLYHSDIWYAKKTGVIWVIKKNLIEILLHIELNNFELINSKTNSFRKKHKQYLKDNNLDLVLDFLSLVLSFYHKDQDIHTTLFTTKIENTLIKKPSNKEDLFFMSFYAWLKAKTNKSNLYDTTLEVINSSKVK